MKSTSFIYRILFLMFFLCNGIFLSIAQYIEVPPPSCVYCNVTFRTGNESHLSSCPYYVASENYSSPSGSNNSNNTNIIDKIFKAIEERIKINQQKKAERSIEQKKKEEMQNKEEAKNIALMYQKMYKENEYYNEYRKSEINKSAISLKDKYIKSSALKSVKQLNCGAYNSLQSLQSSRLNLNDFRNLETPLELTKKTADFSIGNISTCPEVTFKDYDVTIQNPIGSQEKYYQRILAQTDSIKTVISTISLEKIKNDSVVKATEIKIKEYLQTKEKIVAEVNSGNEKTTEEQKELDDLFKAAMELEKTATEEQDAAISKNKKITEDYQKCFEKIDQLEKSRKLFDKTK